MGDGSTGTTNGSVPRSVAASTGVAASSAAGATAAGSDRRLGDVPERAGSVNHSADVRPPATMIIALMSRFEVIRNLRWLSSSARKR